MPIVAVLRRAGGAVGLPAGQWPQRELARRPLRWQASAMSAARRPGLWATARRPLHGWGDLAWQWVQAQRREERLSRIPPDVVPLPSGCRGAVALRQRRAARRPPCPPEAPSRSPGRPPPLRHRRGGSQIARVATAKRRPRAVVRPCDAAVRAPPLGGQAAARALEPARGRRKPMARLSHPCVRQMMLLRGESRRTDLPPWKARARGPPRREGMVFVPFPRPRQAAARPRPCAQRSDPLMWALPSARRLASFAKPLGGGCSAAR